MVNPGSHRLGFHGEFIQDIQRVKELSDLPDWVPRHDIWNAKSEEHWITTVGEQNETSVHVLTVENSKSNHLALAEIIPNLEGETLILSGDCDNLKRNLSTHLRNYGIRIQNQNIKLIESSAVTRVLEIIRLSRGEDAWSLSRLIDLASQIELPLRWEFMNLEHPTQKDWKPQMHIDAMIEIARGFHLLGGRGSLKRWLSTLANATPRSSIYFEEKKKQLEESQWWLSCISCWMDPILPDNDRELENQFFIGCSTHEKLPLPQRPSDVTSWFNSLSSEIDWEALAKRDRTFSTILPSLQKLFSLISAYKKEGFTFHKDDLIDTITSIAKNTEIEYPKGSDSSLQILEPETGYGVQSDNVIFCGIDSETWTMKPSKIPWLDEKTRLNLGLHKPDEPLRRGRHQLRHFLNAAKTVVIIDSTIEDGIEFSGPIDEWMNSISQQGEVSTLYESPYFISPDEWKPSTKNRPWEWRTIDGNTRLVLRINSMETTDEGVLTHRSGNLPRDEIQRSGLSIFENREPSLPPLNPKSIAYASEYEILIDQIDRKQIGKDLDEHQELKFASSNNLMNTSTWNLLPNNKVPANGRSATEWPHLGIMGKKSLSLSVDPRPINPPSTNFNELDEVMGRGVIEIKPPRAWSQGRLQAWLECPRKAWYEKHLYFGKEDNMREDLSALTRGDIVHKVAESVMRAHGLEEGKLNKSPVAIDKGNLPDIQSAWNVALETIKDNATWMKRSDGISAHRSVDLIGVSPSEWTEYIEAGQPINIGGRLGRMLVSDYEMTDIAPLACEWELVEGNQSNVEISIPGTKDKFRLTGRIDRVDKLLTKHDWIDPNASEITPLDIDLGDEIKSRRLVIIRDIKSMDGSKDNDTDLRHKKAIFEELQLGLYARAWELSNPGDRVIGVGVTTVGNKTIHRVEVDPEFYQLCKDLKVGKCSKLTHQHYRIPGEPKGGDSNPFRAWMRERITTAIRAVNTMKSGKNHPQPSSDLCKYCSISEACSSAHRGDE